MHHGGSCPHCGVHYLDEPRPTCCLNCGATLPSTNRTSRQVFWTLSFTTPVLATATAWFTWGIFPRLRSSLPQGLYFLGDLARLAAPAVLVVGAWGAGYFLAKSYAPSLSFSRLVAESIVYTIGILVAYALILFIGLLFFAQDF